MTPEAMQHIKDAGYVSGDGRLLRKEMAAALVPMVADDLRVVHGSDETERETKTQTLDELAHALFAHTDPELRALMAQLTSVDGPVQKALADGVVLCPWRVERPLGNGEAASMRKVAGRFVTDNEDVVKQTVLEAGARRVVSAARKVGERHQMAVKRLPGLATYRPQLANFVYDEVRLALPETTTT